MYVDFAFENAKCKNDKYIYMWKISDGVSFFVYKLIVHVTRGENKLFLARVRYSAQVEVEGAECCSPCSLKNR